jgi:hypothetical protein
LAILLVVLNHSIVISVLAPTATDTHSSGVERFLLEAMRGLGLIAVPTFLFISGGFVVYALR